ncbi:peptidase M4 family protein [Nonomuraea sp. WAC 01424]|uniref:M4 family metallopeptidase n=1 Tax=Nonomuraea sp. WAC 01424 TaxID=2203200 RepID=UPI000F791E5A|nr:M4 family metallopeptidase [Nonomuraea sp. WAC 01424]RSN11791.1 peptidase M4 family protein [Nonomuraea sp. WAC 01424]
MRRNAVLALVTSAVCVLVATSVPVPANASKGDPADLLVKARPSLLHSSPKDTYVRQGLIEGQGGLRYTTYTRTYAGLPVYGGDFVVVSTATGEVLSTSVSQDSALDVATTPRLGAADAVRVARSQLPEVFSVTTPRLVVMAQGRGRLAYEVTVHGTIDGRQSKLHVFVDALTGAVALKSDEVRAGVGNSYYNGNPVTIGTTGTGASFSMVDPVRRGVRCGGQNGSTYTGADDNWGNGSGTDFETACVDVLYAIDTEWDMLKTWLGRDGFNGLGDGYPARVGLNDINAYWTGSYAAFGRTSDSQRQLTSMDVVAHEYGHIVFATTPGLDLGDNEKAILNESTGDILAALTEQYANQPAAFDPPDYTVGEEINIVGSGPLRYMYKPSLIPGDPDCFSSAVPPMFPQIGAGVQNHWFYLLAEGTNPTNGQPPSPTCNYSTIVGIGARKAGQIYMGTLLRKTTSWSHTMARRASMQAALALFPGSCLEYNTVKAAWNAVRVPAHGGEPYTCDFSVDVAPAAATVQPGRQVSVTVTSATVSGAPQQIALQAKGLPAGMTASFSPASITTGATSTLTFTVGASTVPGTYTITVLGDGVALDRTATLTLTVAP